MWNRLKLILPGIIFLVLGLIFWYPISFLGLFLIGIGIYFLKPLEKEFE